MRLIQEAVLPESETAHLAEVFLGGLLYRVGEEVGTDFDSVQYEFHPGVRELLNNFLERDELVTVLSLSSSYVSERFGHPLDFAALLTDPEGAELPALVGPGQGRPLAHVAVQVLSRLGGRYAGIAERLRAVENASGQPDIDSDGDEASVGKILAGPGVDDANGLAEATVDKAIESLESVRAEYRRVLGSDHPDTLNALHELAGAYLVAEDFTNALNRYEEALAGRGRVLGGSHPDTIATRKALAAAYLSAGQLSLAVDHYERLLVDCTSAFGAEHPETLACMEFVACQHEGTT